MDPPLCGLGLSQAKSKRAVHWLGIGGGTSFCPNLSLLNKWEYWKKRAVEVVNADGNVETRENAVATMATDSEAVVEEEKIHYKRAAK